MNTQLPILLLVHKAEFFEAPLPSPIVQNTDFAKEGYEQFCLDLEEWRDVAKDWFDEYLSYPPADWARYTHQMAQWWPNKNPTYLTPELAERLQGNLSSICMVLLATQQCGRDTNQIIDQLDLYQCVYDVLVSLWRREKAAVTIQRVWRDRWMNPHWFIGRRRFFGGLKRGL